MLWILIEAELKKSEQKDALKELNENEIQFELWLQKCSDEQKSSFKEMFNNAKEKFIKQIKKEKAGIIKSEENDEPNTC